MTQDKMRRIITACVSAATVLLVFLLGYLIFQWVSLGVQKKKIAEVTAEIQVLEERLEALQKEEDSYKDIVVLQMQLNDLQAKKDSIEGKK